VLVNTHTTLDCDCLHCWCLSLLHHLWAGCCLPQHGACHPQDEDGNCQCKEERFVQRNTSQKMPSD